MGQRTPISVTWTTPIKAAPAEAELGICTVKFSYGGSIDSWNRGLYGPLYKIWPMLWVGELQPSNPQDLKPMTTATSSDPVNVS